MFPNAQLTFCTFEAAGLPGGEGAGAGEGAAVFASSARSAITKAVDAFPTCWPSSWAPLRRLAAHEALRACDAAGLVLDLVYDVPSCPAAPVPWF